jgi:hypothetical protein
MTKQANEEHEEKQTIDLLLRRYKIMDELVEKVKQDNIRAGVEDNPNVMKQFLPWTDFVQRRIKYNGWISAVTNPKNGKFNDVKYLRRRELIEEDQAVEHESKTYPYRKLDSLYRIKTPDGKQYLMRLEGWYGLDMNGEEKRISVNEIDFYVKPTVRYDRIPKDPKEPNGPSIRVGSIVPNNGGDAVGEKVYLTPYSIEKVKSL